MRFTKVIKKTKSAKKQLVFSPKFNTIAYHAYSGIAS